MKKKLLAAFLCSVLALNAVIPTFAASPTSGSAQTTPVEFESSETEWTWEVPAAQNFTDQSLDKTSSVKIKPLNDGEVIVLDYGTNIKVTLNSANGFALKKTDDSKIPYEVKKDAVVLNQNDTVLTYTAGVSSNTGVEQELSFTTTPDNIKNAKLSGLHSDSITFTLNAGVVYTVTDNTADDAHGSINVANTVSKGNNLVLTVVPDEGYQLASLQVTHAGSIRDVEDEVLDGSYTLENVQGDVVVSATFASDTSTVIVATFNDGAELSWDELKLAENGAKYSYDASKITDDAIGDKAFWCCFSLTSITIPDGVSSIGDQAFNGCSKLASITIPDSVSSIGYGIFRNCDRLTSITVDENNTTYSSMDGVLFNKNKTELIQYPIGNTNTSYNVPDSVTSIGDFAFDYCFNLTSITIPNSVTSIGKDAFAACYSLTSITIPDGVTSIGEKAFYNCNKLTSITIPDRIISIGKYAFSGCSSLTSITIPDSVTFIGDHAFENCSSLTSITIPDGVTTICDYTFFQCNKLTSIAIPDSVTSIGKKAFVYCYYLTSITIPEGITSISEEAFYYCTCLSNITFNGTTSEWESITKGSNWNSGMPSDYVVHCTDGDI